MASLRLGGKETMGKLSASNLNRLNLVVGKIRVFKHRDCLPPMPEKT